jgi:hypothetical protein
MLFFRDYFGVFEKSQFDCNIISFVQSDARRHNSDIRSDTLSKQNLVETYGLEIQLLSGHSMMGTHCENDKSFEWDSNAMNIR